MAFIAMRTMAGYAPNSDYFLPRSRCEPPESLMGMMFPWVEEEVEKIEAAFRDSEGLMGRSTARGFLLCLKNMRRIILQDVAAMIVENEERWRHPLLEMEVFQRDEFKEYVLEMGAKLSDSALEAEARGQIDKALRGMNKRFDCLEAKWEKREDGLVTRIRQTLKETVTDEFSRIDLAGQLADNFDLAASAIRGGSPSAMRNVGESSKAVRGASSEEEDAPACFGHKAKMGYSPSDSIFEIYDEYYGLKFFVGVPIAGGLHAMEEQYGTKWRKVGVYWTSADQKHFSRIKSIMVGVEKGVANGRDEMELLRQLDHIYNGDNNKKGTNLAGCVTYLQEEGLLERKQRQKRRRDEDSTTEA